MRSSGPTDLHLRTWRTRLTCLEGLKPMPSKGKSSDVLQQTGRGVILLHERLETIISFDCLIPPAAYSVSKSSIAPCSRPAESAHPSPCHQWNSPSPAHLGKGGGSAKHCQHFTTRDGHALTGALVVGGRRRDKVPAVASAVIREPFLSPHHRQ